MVYSYVNKNGKRVNGSSAQDHFIKENSGWESHNQKMAMFGDEHATDLLPLKDVILNSVKNEIPKLFSKKNNKKKK